MKHAGSVVYATCGFIGQVNSAFRQDLELCALYAGILKLLIYPLPVLAKPGTPLLLAPHFACIYSSSRDLKLQTEEQKIARYLVLELIYVFVFLCWLYRVLQTIIPCVGRLLMYCSNIS